ncbi:MAG: hypothetical protein KGI79_01560 [Patescibacteria group bacterium]|nr:hypothetical protein [Patescibacteria group bacterium]MDE2116543.1 hypothetical protein [Patescibacteria group bacterium]
MKKVRTIFLMRKLAAPFVFLVVAAGVVASTVSIPHVIANMPAVADIPAVARFYAAAFAHTDVVVKSALVAGILFLLWALKGLVESLRFSAELARAS